MKHSIRHAPPHGPELSRVVTPPCPATARRRTVGIVTALLLTFAPGPGVSAATLYVAKTGTDNASCSEAAPCATVQWAVMVAAAGDTIKVGKGDYGGGLSIEKDLTIEGVDALTTRISGAWEGQNIVTISEGASVRLTNLQIRRGAAGWPLYGSPGGSGISNFGELELHDVWVRSNRAALSGGGIDNRGSLVMYGGEIALNVTDPLEGRSATAGGGLRNWDGAWAALIGVRVGANKAEEGGGIYNTGDLVVLDSVVAANQAEGINSLAGTMYLENVTVSRNDGGGAVVIYSADPTTLVNVTIAENDVSSGLRVVAGANVLLANTIIANNGRPAGQQCRIDTSNYAAIGSLDSDNTCLLNTWPGANLSGVDPRLGPLKNNGGPTSTHALLADSPAIDSGSNDFCPPVDQRGRPRPVDGDGDGEKRCDIGAYEFAITFLWPIDQDVE